MAWIPSDDLKPSEVLESAVDDTDGYRYEDALQKFLWFHDASRKEPGMGGVRLSFALGYWKDLASRFPPALTALIALRDETEARCLANGGDFESFHDASALNNYLDREQRTLDLFLQIAKDSPESAKRIYHVAEKYLVAAGMYQACAPFLEWKHRVETSISAYRLGLKWEQEIADQEHPPPPFARSHFQNQIANLVALLSLNHRTDEAQQVCDLCLTVLNDDAFRDALETARKGNFPATEADQPH